MKATQAIQFEIKEGNKIAWSLFKNGFTSSRAAYAAIPILRQASLMGDADRYRKAYLQF